MNRAIIHPTTPNPRLFVFAGALISACVPTFESPAESVSAYCDVADCGELPSDAIDDPTNNSARETDVQDTNSGTNRTDNSDATDDDGAAELNTPSDSVSVRCTTSADCDETTICVDGLCTMDCDPGRAGQRCEIVCPGAAGDGLPCNDRGTCDDGRDGTGLCTCSYGYTGVSCDQRRSTRYGVTTYTGTTRYAGTDDYIDMRAIGAAGSTPWTRLDTPDNEFGRGEADPFSFECAYIGPVERIEFRILGNSRGECCDDWFVERVVVDDGNATYTFDPRRWLGDDEPEWGMQ
jgi:hypothetical protein